MHGIGAHGLEPVRREGGGDLDARPRGDEVVVADPEVHGAGEDKGLGIGVPVEAWAGSGFRRVDDDDRDATAGQGAFDFVLRVSCAECDALPPFLLAARQSGPALDLGTAVTALRSGERYSVRW